VYRVYGYLYILYSAAVLQCYRNNECDVYFTTARRSRSNATLQTTAIWCQYEKHYKYVVLYGVGVYTTPVVYMLHLLFFVYFLILYRHFKPLSLSWIKLGRARILLYNINHINVIPRVLSRYAQKIYL